MLNITHMTCEHRINPLAIENPNPRFSWEIHSEEPGVFQTARSEERRVGKECG